MGAHRLLHHLLALGLSLGLAACASTPHEHVSSDYAREVMRRVEKAQAEVLHRVRYNPCGCDCPPFELAVQTASGLKWLRVELLGDGEADGLDEHLTEQVSVGREFQVRGTLESDPNALPRCGKGAFYVELNVTALQGLN